MAAVRHTAFLDPGKSATPGRTANFHAVAGIFADRDKLRDTPAGCFGVVLSLFMLAVQHGVAPE